MRAMSIAVALVLLAMPQITSAKEPTKSQQPVAGASPSKIEKTDDTAALGKAAREKDEARQRAWDKKTRSITRGICSGC
jgi:hypothetical protein